MSNLFIGVDNVCCNSKSIKRNSKKYKKINNVFQAKLFCFFISSRNGKPTGPSSKLQCLFTYVVIQTMPFIVTLVTRTHCSFKDNTTPRE